MLVGVRVLVAQPGEDEPDVAARSLEFGADGAVGLVADPAPSLTPVVPPRLGWHPSGR